MGRSPKLKPTPKNWITSTVQRRNLCSKMRQTNTPELRQERHHGLRPWNTQNSPMSDALHLANLKNCWLPEMGLVTVFCSLMMTGAGDTAVQFEEPRFVV